MRAYQRRQLKQDAFTATAKETVSWAVENRTQLIYGGIIAAVVLCIALGIWYETGYQEEPATAALGQGVQIYNAALRAEGEPAQPGVPSYTSAKERADAAAKQFQVVISRYPRTRSAKWAHYFLGLSEVDMGDNGAAERELKSVADSGPKDLSSLGKMALAAVYRDSGRADQAIKLYQDLIAHPTETVSKSTAQLQLADLYGEKQPAEAKKIYQEIQKDSPQSPAAEIAANKLQTLK